MTKDESRTATAKTIPIAQIAFGVVVLLAVAWSAQARLSQYAIWNAEPSRYFDEGRPLLTSADGYYWLRLAEEHRDGTYAADGDLDPLRAYPDGAKKPRPVPLLSFLVVAVSSVTGTGLYETAARFVPLLACLFIVPLAYYFLRVGLPEAGILGGLIAGFGHEYLTRTSIGAVDTDALNLFFPALASFLVLLACESRSKRRTLIWSALTGLTLLLFYWWYFHAGFNLVYLVLLVVCLRVHRVAWKTTLSAAGLLAVASNPLLLWKACVGLHAFVTSAVFGSPFASVAERVKLPEILYTSAERQTASPLETLGLVLAQPWLTLAGLLLFATAAVSRWKRLLPLAPVLVLGLLAFRSGHRFAIFLGPFVGAGYGYLLYLALNRLFRKGPARPALRDLAGCGGALVLFALALGQTAAGHEPRPWLNRPTISTFGRLAERLPRGSAVLTWWDYGYPLGALGGFATYHDGSSHGLVSYLIARALASTSQQELYATAAFVGRTGQERMTEMLEGSRSPAEMLDGVSRFPQPIETDDVYLLLLNAMVPKYAAIHYLGTWDTERGAGTPDGYQKLSCSSWTGGKIQCDGMVIEVATGSAREDLALEKLIVIRDGVVIEEQAYPRDTGVHLQVLADRRGVTDFYLLDERVFQSNFNQMYFLNRYDPRLFEPVYDDFPTARAFRFKPLTSPGR